MFLPQLYKNCIRYNSHYVGVIDIGAMEFVRVWWTYIRPSMYSIYVTYVRDLNPPLVGTSYNPNHNEALPIPLSFQKISEGGSARS